MADNRDTRAIVTLLRQIGLSIRQRFNLALEGNDLRHFLALRELDAGPMGQRALAQALRTSPAKMVGLLNELEAERLIERTRDPRDRRRHIVTITAKGSHQLSQIMTRCEQFEESIVADLDPEARRRLLESLAIVGHRLEINVPGHECPNSRAE